MSPPPDRPVTGQEAAAVAAAVGAGASVLVVGVPPPGLGEALDDRGCDVTLLGPPGTPADQAWAARVGTVDEARPDPGSLDGFDAVVAPHLLDLAADPTTALRRMTGALRTRGLIVLVAGGPAPPGALHRHDPAQVERLCELAGLAVQAVAVPDGSTTVVVARRVAPAPSSAAVGRSGPPPATPTTAVDRRLRDQRARIRALEDEVRALRADDRRPRGAALLSRGAPVARVARAVRTRMRARG